MGDSINVDWGLAQDQANATGSMPQTMQQSALAGYQLGEKQAERTALNGMDVNDPSSVANATSGLVRAGNLEAAKGLSDLGYSRDIWNQYMGKDAPLAKFMARHKDEPDVQAASSAASAPPQATALSGMEGPAPAAPQGAPAPGGAPAAPGNFNFDPQHAYDSMNMAAHAAHELMQMPPDKRYDAATDTSPGSIRDSFAKRGLPPQAIDAALDDLSDGGLQEKRDHYSQIADTLARNPGVKAARKPGQVAPVETGPNGETTVNVVGSPPTGNPPPAAVAPPAAQGVASAGGGGTAVPAAQTPPEPVSIPMHASTHSWSKDLLAHPEVIQQIAAMRKYGLDLTPLVSTAYELESPNISRQSELEYTQPLARAQGENTLVTTEQGGRQVQSTRNQVVDAVKSRGLSPNGPPPLGAPGVGLNPEESAYMGGTGTEKAAAPYTVVTAPVGPEHTPQAMTKSVFLQGQGAPGFGTGQSPREAAFTQADTQNATEFQKNLSGMRLQLQQDQLRGSKIAALADTVGTGKYGPAINELARSIPLGPRAQQYATDAGILGADMAGAFAQTARDMGSDASAGSVAAALPHIQNQADQIKLSGLGIKAASGYRAQYADFMEHHLAVDPSYAKAQAAWDAGPGKRSFLADPAFEAARIHNERGQLVPAVVIDRNPKSKTYGQGVLQLPGAPVAFRAF